MSIHCEFYDTHQCECRVARFISENDAVPFWTRCRYAFKMGIVPRSVVTDCQLWVLGFGQAVSPDYSNVASSGPGYATMGGVLRGPRTSEGTVDGENVMRPTKHQCYLEIALVQAHRGTCLRRCYGAVIVSALDRIVSTGYCGSPRGARNCSDGTECPRNAAGCQPGEGYELCCSVHAEQNAIISASLEEMDGATMYVSGFDVEGGQAPDCTPCCLCRRMILNAGIVSVIVATPGERLRVLDPQAWIVEGRLAGMS